MAHAAERYGLKIIAPRRRLILSIAYPSSRSSLYETFGGIALEESAKIVNGRRKPNTHFTTPTYRIPDAGAVPHPPKDVEPDIEGLHIERGQEVVEGQQGQEDVRPGEEVEGSTQIKHKPIRTIRVQCH